MLKHIKQIVFIIATIIISLSYLFPFQQVKAAAFDPKTGQENISLRFWNNESPELGFYINAASRYILETVQEPNMGSTFGEWSVMDLARGMYTGYDYINYIPANYFTDYKSRIDSYIDGVSGELDRNKSTEWSRLTLAMSALGYNVRSMGSGGQYDFVDRLSQSYKFSYKQGINGPIWELIALNTGRYELLENPSTFTSKEDINTAGKMIDYIIDKEIIQTNGIVGGWALMGNVPDPDITGMALQGLAPYYTGDVAYPKDTITSYNDFKKAVERAVYQLADMQQPNGGYNAFGNLNVESTVQAVVALTELGIDPTAKNVDLPNIGKVARFNQSGGMRDGVYTDNMMDAVYTFWAWGSGSTPEVGGFKHVTTGYDGGGGSGTGVNAMATDQALYGLIAYDRFKKGENSLYNMTDQINGEYRNMQARKVNVTFVGNTSDVQSESPYAAISIPALTNDRKKVIAWNTASDGSGVSYFPGERLSIPDHDITLYAQFESRDFNIQYELNGGQFTTDRYTTTYKNIDNPALPTAKQLKKEGYQFVGWYDNASFTGEAITTIAKGESGDRTFYAKWIDKNALVNEVIEQIKILPTTVVAENALTIENVRTMYDTLTPAQKASVTNYNKLLDAEQQLKGALASSSLNVTDAELSEGVVALIQTIPTTKEMTLDSQSIINQARDAYDKLTTKQKADVYNYQLLIRAEKALKAIESKEVDEKAAAAVINQIKQLPEKITVASEEKIGIVRTAYDVLTAYQQDLVTNYNTLLQKEIALKAALSNATLKVDTFKNNVTSLTGKSESAATITATIKGKEIGHATASKNGEFSIVVPQQKAGTTIIVKSIGKITAIKSVNVQTSKTLGSPTVNTVKSTHTKITGKAPKNTTITVYNAKNKKIATGTVSNKGTFTLKITKQKKKTKLYVQITDKWNNQSKKKVVTVK